MNGPLILLGLALVSPVLGRWFARRPGRRSRPLHGRALLTVLAVSAAFWIALAWITTVPRVSGQTWDAPAFFLISLLGVAWVETTLLLGRRGWFPRSVPDGEPDGGDHPESEDGDEEESELTSPQLPDEAKELLARVLDLSKVSAEAIMTPRSKLVAVEASSTVAETLARMQETQRPRLLVIEGSIDRILGVAHAKDLARLAAAGETARPVRGLTRRLLRLPQFVPTTKLIEEFQQSRVSIGVVGDRRGRTLGLVTRSDVFRYVATGQLGMIGEEQ